MTKQQFQEVIERVKDVCNMESERLTLKDVAYIIQAYNLSPVGKKACEIEVESFLQSHYKNMKRIKQALQAAGYDSEPTRENLIDCYLDYVTAFGGDIDDTLDDINCDIITEKHMCNALIRCN